MPIEGGIAEKDWTPIQREMMTGWNRLWTRDRQWLQVGRWRIVQQHMRDWICLAQIADWCARRPGDIERDPSRRAQAYSDLGQSIILGEFNRGGRLKVVYLPPQQPNLLHPMKLRLNADRLLAHQGHALDYLLDLCWAPRDLCLRWLLVRQIVPPPWLVAEPIRVILAPKYEASIPAAASAPLPSRASEERIHAAIDFVYASATGKPPNLKQLIPLVKAQLATTNHVAAGRKSSTAPRTRVTRGNGGCQDAP
jgi:hypothetical protein